MTMSTISIDRMVCNGRTVSTDEVNIMTSEPPHIVIGNKKITISIKSNEYTDGIALKMVSENMYNNCSGFGYYKSRLVSPAEKGQGFVVRKHYVVDEKVLPLVGQSFSMLGNFSL